MTQNYLNLPLSGERYCLKHPQLLEALTLGLLGGYAHCSKLHTLLLPGVLSVIMGLHILASAEATSRRMKVGREGAGLAPRIYVIYRGVAWVASSLLVALGLLDLVGLL